MQFIRNSQIVDISNVSPDRTLLDLLREDLGIRSCKEGCGEGDCGACAVVLAELDPAGTLEYKAINSCIRLASSIQGKALWTAQDIAKPDAPDQINLHPVQQAMQVNHASQCGFCTPGFVMSLFALYQSEVKQGKVISRACAEHALSGNLCRCTGYRPITDAAMSLETDAKFDIDEAALIAKLLPLQRPISLVEFVQARYAMPQAQVVAGTTDVGLWINKLHKKYEVVHDITQVTELKNIASDDQAVHIGAAVSLQKAFEAMQVDRPTLKSFKHRFAGLPVRNSGTLGGNIVNGSPIGDSMPLLISLGATVSLARWDGSDVKQREVAVEKLYLGYRQNVLLPDEILTHIHVPKPPIDEFSRVYKISKRFEDDISAVCLAINIQLKDGALQAVSIGVGGVAAVPARAHQTEALLVGKPWNKHTVEWAKTSLQSEFSPISDMRASKDYRRTLLAQLLERFWLETQGQTQVSLADISVVQELL